MRFLFVDRITAFKPRHYVRGERTIKQDEFYLCKDAQGELCFVPSLVGETLGQLAAWNVMHSLDFASRPVAGVVSSVIFSGAARPGETLTLESFIDELDEKAVSYHSVATVEGREVLRVEGALGPLLPMESFIDSTTVRAQFDALFQTTPDHDLRCLSPINERLLCCDKITSETSGEGLTGRLFVAPDAPWFADHFPRKPVLPMTVLIECMSNLAREFLARNALQGYRLQEVRKIKMNAFVEPGSTLLVNVRQKACGSDEQVLVLRSDLDGRRVCVCEMRFSATGG